MAEAGLRAGEVTLLRHGREHFVRASDLGKEVLRARGHYADGKPALRGHKGGLARQRRLLLLSAIERGTLTRDDADTMMLEEFGLLMEPTRSRPAIRARAAQLGVAFDG